MSEAIKIVDYVKAKGLLSQPNFELSKEEIDKIHGKVLNKSCEYEEYDIDENLMKETAKYLAKRNSKGQKETPAESFVLEVKRWGRFSLKTFDHHLSLDAGACEDELIKAMDSLKEGDRIEIKRAGK